MKTNGYTCPKCGGLRVYVDRRGGKCIQRRCPKCSDHNPLFRVLRKAALLPRDTSPQEKAEAES